ncbi:MAG: DUF4363 family protein [Clostridia bacterium]|nr:DUF4363 family protein [Clostridia bacterium]
MRTWVILVSFSLALAIFSIGENHVMNKFYSEIDSVIYDIRDDLSNNRSPASEVEKLNNIWKSTKVWAYIYSSHESFDDYEECINDIQEYLKLDVMPLIYYKTLHLENTNNHLKESLIFKAENIF